VSTYQLVQATEEMVVTGRVTVQGQLVMVRVVACHDKVSDIVLDSRAERGH
jgi:hypothetical protein